MEDVRQLIPHRPPFLFVDEVVARGEDNLTARRAWRSDEDFYKGHYPGAPITPGVLLCEAVFQTGALLLAGRFGGAGKPAGVPLLTKVENVRFRNPVYPGDTTLIEVRIKEAAVGFYFMAGSMKTADKRILTVDFSVAWKTPEGLAAP